MKASFATLTSDDGSYLQVAGGPGLFLLEQRVCSGAHFRAWQATPIVPFEDGTILAFSGGKIALSQDEWFKRSQMAEALVSFVAGQPLPAYIHWRALSGSFLPVA